MKLQESIPASSTPVKAAAAAAHAQRIYFITGSRPAAPARPGNHLVCFHIHSYEAVICPADCEAGGCLLVLSPRGPAGLCGPLNLQNPTAPETGRARPARRVHVEMMSHKLKCSVGAFSVALMRRENTVPLFDFRVIQLGSEHVSARIRTRLTLGTFT